MSKQAFKRIRRLLSLLVNREPLPGFSWPGGYPIYYLCADGEHMCPKCVNDNIKLIDEANSDEFERQWKLIGCDCNWDDETMRCSNCGDWIPNAYSSPHGEERHS